MVHDRPPLDLKPLVDNTLFRVPGTRQLLQLNRGNLRAILLNVGNDSNLTKLAKGYENRGVRAGQSDIGDDQGPFPGLEFCKEQIGVLHKADAPALR